MKRDLKRVRLLAGAVAIVLGSTCAIPPAAAAEPAPAPLAAAVAAQVAALPDEATAGATKSAVPAAPASAAVAADRPFHKTTKGAVALALLAGTFGYAVYSFSNGRVKSPAK